MMSFNREAGRSMSREMRSFGIERPTAVVSHGTVSRLRWEGPRRHVPVARVPPSLLGVSASWLLKWVGGRGCPMIEFGTVTTA